MKVTLLITTYNRPAYLKRCLDSVERAGIKNVLIMDDCSTDQETILMLKNSTYNVVLLATRKGICASLLFGIELAFAQGADIVINLDADAIIRNDFLEKMLELHAVFPNDIITGFHSTTKNKDGSERHKIIEGGWQDGKNEWCRKQSVGGVNMLWTPETWKKYKPVIEDCALHGGNWDHRVSLASGGIICAVPSLVEHIGIESAMGHTGKEPPDTAADFKMLSLPNVTLVCVDDNYEHAERAIILSTKNIEFNKHLILTNIGGHTGHLKIGSDWIEGKIEVQNIPTLKSKEAYSKFIIKELHKYIKTDYALIVQHDGYVKNPEAWTDAFLNYDYIGACWWYKDGRNVGNGGFSLRSKKLLELSALMPGNNFHPEDHVICREMRPWFEQYGAKFAPEELANKFSFEGYFQQGTWNGQFGFHGARALRVPPDPKKQGFIINQFLGLGDILFLVPMIRYWMSQGHDVIWPIADEYFDIRRHFNDIQFVKKSDWKFVQYQNQNEYNQTWKYGLYRVKPLRWNKCVNPEDAMISKYKMVGLDWQMWRGLSWERDLQKEQRLKDILNIKDEYILMFNEFGNITDGGTNIKSLSFIQKGIEIIYAKRHPDFTLLDWSGIIENATVIHAVSSSTLYLFEMLNLKAKEVHLYSRKAGQRDFDYIKPLMTKDYILHL